MDGGKTVSTVCEYCGVEFEGKIVPELDDEEGWSIVALEHDQACEWVLTRAHRMDQRPKPRARKALSVMLTAEERMGIDAAAGLEVDPHASGQNNSVSAWARRVLLAAAERAREAGR